MAFQRERELRITCYVLRESEITPQKPCKPPDNPERSLWSSRNTQYATRFTLFFHRKIECTGVINISLRGIDKNGGGHRIWIVRVAVRFFSGVPHPHLLGVCCPNIFSTSA